MGWANVTFKSCLASRGRNRPHAIALALIFIFFEEGPGGSVVVPVLSGQKVLASSLGITRERCQSE